MPDGAAYLAPVEGGPSYTESDGEQFNRNDVDAMRSQLSFTTALVLTPERVKDALDSLLMHAACETYITDIEKHAEEEKAERGTLYSVGVLVGYHLAMMAMMSLQEESEADELLFPSEDCGDPDCPVHGKDAPKEVLH